MKALSKNNSELKVIFPLLISLFGGIILFVLLREYPIFKYFALSGVIILGIKWAQWTYKKSYNLFFNTDHLILKNTKNERNISITNIVRIKLTLSNLRIMGFQFYEYLIDFKNEEGLTERISFFVSGMSSSLWEFQDLVSSTSSKAIIENHANSWEK